MSRIQSGKNRNPEKPVSGCLGRIVNLFDLNTSVGVNKLLTDKPHHDGSTFSRRQSDVSNSSLVDNQMDDKMIFSDLKKSPSNRKSNGTPIKTLIAQEMSKEEDCKQSPSNLVAKLMGLEAFPPHHQPSSASHRNQSQSLEFLKQEQGECKDVYEIHQNNSPQKQKMALVCEKFMEAKRLSTDEKLRQSKQFQDALEVLSSNKDMFLKFLQEPNSLFSPNLYNLQSVTPPPDCRRITVLKPSKITDPGKKNEKHKNSDFLFSEYPTQPTRIMVLKPSSIKPSNIKVVVESHDDEILSGLRRDETLLSSVFSNGYIGDDSSYCKSEIDYAVGNLSDSEVISLSPTSRHSWDYINRFNSHYCASSSRTSYSPESSVCREAKKRLSERWAVMSSNKNVQEHKEIQRSSSTLGDMLALSDLKKSEKSEEKNDTNNTPRSLLRSKSVPASATQSEETKDLVKEKLVKSLSFKVRVSSLFFSKNKKSIKEKSQQSKDVSQCVSDSVIEEATCSGLKQGIILPEAGFSFAKNVFSGNNIENQDQPSPISVLEPPFEEDDSTINCHHNSRLNGNGIDSMKYNLIDKSPPIGSIARTLSWDDSVGSSTPYLGKPSSRPLNPEQEEQECLFYVQTLLSVSGLTKVHPNSFLTKWHSPESPLDPSLRDKYMNLSEKELILIQTKQKHPRPITKLVFDCVNKALIDIATRGPYTLAHNSLDDMAMSSTVLVDRVWAHMKEWISGEERCDRDDGDDGSVVVNKEVVGKGWMEGLRLESDNTRKEIEEKLLEELVHEYVLELTGR